MSATDKTFLGRRMMDFTSSPAFQPYSRVTLWVDDNNCYTAGDDTGRTLEADCPWATQEICNAVLARVKGYQYVPYTATDAMIDPAAEIGDGASVNGRYSVLASIEATFDPMFTATVAAPADEELDHEYPYKSSASRALDRKLAQTRAAITVKADEIMAQVEDELNGLSSSIDVKLGSITSQVTGLNGQISMLEQTDTSLSSQISNVSGAVSTLNQKVDSITLSVRNGSDSSTISLSVDGITVSSKTIRFTGGVVFEDDLADGTTVIDGGCIQTGEIAADYIKLGGAMEVYRTTTSSIMGGYIGYVTSYDYNGSRTTGMGMLNPDEDCQVVVTNAGARLTSPNAEVVAAANVTLTSDYSVVVSAANFKSDVDLTVSSDRNFKDDIRYDIADKYLSLFDRLLPASFLYKNKEAVRHIGFIAQEVEDAANVCGISRSDLALLSQDEQGRYGLNYSEFIPILVAKIKSLESRLETLSA